MTEREVCDARKVLKTNAASTYTQIRKAYLRSCRERHPDLNKCKGHGKANSTRDLGILQAAYKVLMNHRSWHQRHRYSQGKRRAMMMAKIVLDIQK